MICRKTDTDIPIAGGRCPQSPRVLYAADEICQIGDSSSFASSKARLWCVTDVRPNAGIQEVIVRR